MGTPARALSVHLQAHLGTSLADWCVVVARIGVVHWDPGLS